MPLLIRRAIAEHIVPGRRLGRHVAHDAESRRHPAQTADKIVDAAHKAVGLPLNQGDIGKCTCEAEAGALNAGPNYAGGHVYTDTDTDKLYELETQLEGQPWTPAQPTVNDIGGSGLMVNRAAKQLGWVKTYKHAFGIDAALKALVLRPTIFGVNWYAGFDTPDPKTGLVKISGKIRGGHEICALQIIAEQELVGFAQSWGELYGVPNPAIGLAKAGGFFMSFATVERLLSEEGDATVPYGAAA